MKVSHVAGGLCIAQATALSLSFLFSRFLNDKCWNAHWAQSRPVVLERTNWWRFWRASFYFPKLKGDERKCLDSWLSVMALQNVPVGSTSFAPNISVNDTMVRLEGLQELRDGCFFLSHFFHEVRPVIDAIKREKQGKAVLLHMKSHFEIILRVPFTQYTFHCYNMPSSTTLILEYLPVNTWFNRKRVVTNAEHHWYRGCIWSTLTGSVRSPIGDVGDLSRRCSGFIFGTIQTNKRSFKQRLAEVQKRKAYTLAA